MPSLEESLRAVQRQLGRLRLFTALLGLALVLSFVVPPREVRATRFVLLDQNGDQRGVLRVTEGVPALLLQDEEGRWRAVLSVDDQSASLRLTRQDGDTGVTLSAGDGVSGLTIHGAGGRPEMELRTSPEGPQVVLPGSGQAAPVR